MRRLLLCIALLLLSGPASPMLFGGGAGSGGNTVFTALHTSFIAPTGNDSTGNGTSGNPWLTPNHPSVCGDVFIAAPGTYAPVTLTTQPTGCPSTSAGIDGTGGIYAAAVICNGNTGACLVSSSATSGVLVDFAASNWAYEGFQVTSTHIAAAGGLNGFECDASASGTTIIHDIYLVNDIAYHVQQGYGMNDAGANHNVPGNGCDYMGVVGSIGINANNNPICLAAFDVVGATNSDAAAGTHIFFDGNFAGSNSSVNTCATDMQSYMADTLDAHGYSSQVVFSNNISWASTNFCMQVFYQAYNTSSPTLKAYNFTCYGDLTNVGVGATANGELNFAASASGAAGNPHWNISMTNNIARTNSPTSSGNPIYAMVVGGIQWGASGTLVNTGNVLFGTATTCAGTSCDSSNSETVFNSNPLTSGSQSYTDPLYTNVSDLVNWIGTPTCAVATTTACFGYNVATATLTPNTPISDLVATASGTSGKGYQLPSATPVVNADWPSHMKGLVRLAWNSGNSTVTENPDLVSKPSGM